MAAIVKGMVAVAELAGVSVRRGNKFLLDNVDLRVEEGDRWVVVGPNGAGKTTMLQLLSTQMHPTIGVVDLLGEYLGAVDVRTSALHRRVQFIDRPPDPAARIAKDVVVSAAYGCLAAGARTTTTWTTRVASLMRMLHGRIWPIAPSARRPRVNANAEIARALMSDPELLLLDEPGAGLDLSGREIFVQTLTGTVPDPDAPTMVMVTHHVEEIPVGITHALLMADGRVVAAGPIDEDDRREDEPNLRHAATRDRGRTLTCAGLPRRTLGPRTAVGFVQPGLRSLAYFAANVLQAISWASWKIIKGSTIMPTWAAGKSTDAIARRWPATSWCRRTGDLVAPVEVQPPPPRRVSQSIRVRITPVATRMATMSSQPVRCHRPSRTPCPKAR